MSEENVQGHRRAYEAFRADWIVEKRAPAARGAFNRP